MAGGEAEIPAATHLPDAPPSHRDNLPPVLLLRKPSALDDALSKRFHFLKPSEARAYGFASPLDYIAAHAETVEAVLCSASWPVDKQTIAALPRLRCIATTSAGVDHIDLEECRRRRIAIAYAGDLFTEDVADLAVGLLIDMLRRISAGDRYVRKDLWVAKVEHPLGSKVSGKRVGIVGLGSIGTAIARRLDAFGCVISYNSRKPKPLVSYAYFSDVRELASQSEVLIAACALNEETHHIINKDVLAALGKSGVVINIGRGALVDEKELVRCLVEGEIGGAGLDVFEEEPKVPQELFSLDNVVLSPHYAVFTTESRWGLVKLMAANLEAFFSGRPLLTPYPN